MADAQVRSKLGSPGAGSTANVWNYTGMRIYLRDGQVSQIELRSPAYEASRHLSVGADTGTATRLFGKSCVTGAFAYCSTVGSDPDDRGILLETEDGVITAIRVGSVFDLD